MNMNNLHSLKALDDLLHCNICFDYFNVCMMTACSHNYCSFCIRKYLTYKAECPICFEKASEPELRNNRLIDELVQQHITLRNLLQKIEPGPEYNSVFEENGISSQTDGIKSQELDNIPLASSLSHFSLSLNKDQKSPPESTSELDKAFCPVCSVPVQIKNINNHLDICLKRRSIEKVSGSTEKRKLLPKVVYHLMSDKDLKKRLMEFGLSTKGDRQVLAKRHKSFLVLYNSECDSLNPRPVSEIVKQVEREEKEEGQCPVSVFCYYDRRTDPSIISDEQESYMKVYKKQYDSLIEDVRSRKRNKSAENIGILSGTIKEKATIDCESDNQLNLPNQDIKHSPDIIDTATPEASTTLPTDIDIKSPKEFQASSPELFHDESLSNHSWKENTRNKKILPPPSNDIIDEELLLGKRTQDKRNLQETKTDNSDADRDSSSKER